MENKMREAFERWWTEDMECFIQRWVDNGDYFGGTHDAWLGWEACAQWQAARSAPVTHQAVGDDLAYRDRIKDPRMPERYTTKADVAPVGEAEAVEIMMRAAYPLLSAIIPNDFATEMSKVEKELAMRSAYRALIPHLARSGDEWKPIENAPKDGTKILVFQKRKHWVDQFVVFWREGEDYEDGGHWYIHDGKFDHALRGDSLTHWQPLPTPPGTDEGGR